MIYNVCDVRSAWIAQATLQPQVTMFVEEARGQSLNVARFHGTNAGRRRWKKPTPTAREGTTTTSMKFDGRKMLTQVVRDQVRCENRRGHKFQVKRASCWRGRRRVLWPPIGDTPIRAQYTFAHTAKLRRGVRCSLREDGSSQLEVPLHGLNSTLPENDDAARE